MPAEWFYQLVGVEIGPLSAAELRRHAEDGNVLPDTPVRRGRDGRWVPAAKVKGLLDGLKPPRPPEPALGPSLPLDLARRGWRPYRFEGSDVIVLLPEALPAAFDPEGTLYGTEDGVESAFSATLHGGFEGNRAAALDFVSHLAAQRSLRARDVGTYRYFYDPTNAPSDEVAMRFWVVGLPGAVVVLSLLGTRDEAASPVLAEVRAAIPYLVGELM